MYLLLRSIIGNKRFYCCFLLPRYQLQGLNLTTLTIRVRIPLKHIVFSVNFVFEKNENKQKEAGVGQFFKKQ